MDSTTFHWGSGQSPDPTKNKPSQARVTYSWCKPTQSHLQGLRCLEVVIPTQHLLQQQLLARGIGTPDDLITALQEPKHILAMPSLHLYT